MKESDKPERRSPVRRFAVIAIPSTIVIVAVMVLFLMNAPNGKLLSSLNGTVSAQAAIDQSTVQIQKGSVVKTLVINGDLRAVSSIRESDCWNWIARPPRTRSRTWKRKSLLLRTRLLRPKQATSHQSR